MAERFYDVTLLSDVALTEDGATTGGHKGQDYLRGSLFMGVVASCMGKNFDADLLLSGRVRFLNAYPLVEEEVAFPMPFFFNKIKGEDWEGSVPCLSQNDAPDKQLQQWRSGYLTSSGKVLEIPLKSRMKTAVNRNSRNSEEGQLFGYQHIPRGMRFRMGVQADSEEDLQRVTEFLKEGEVFLGRSRFAEYGAVKLTLSKGSEEPYSAVAPEENRLLLYLASDLVLSREGRVVLVPEPEDFGLSGVRFVPEKSCIRHRRYAPWNSFFNCRMEERQALCKGSVLVFEILEGSPDVEALQKNLASGVGLYTQEGLGQIWVNPSWLVHPPVLQRAPEKSPKAVSKPASTLVNFLQQRRGLRDAGEKSLQLGLKWAKEWSKISKALIEEYGEAPTKNQWSTLRNLALEHLEDSGTFMRELKKFCTEDLRKKIWKDHEVMQGGELVHMYGAVEKGLGEKPHREKILALHHAAVEMSRLLSRPEPETEDSKKGGAQA